MDRAQRFVGTVRRCLQDYDMLHAGDRVAVGVSGGKDSLALLYALAQLREYSSIPFELTALTLSMGFPGQSFEPVAEFCRGLRVPYIIKETNLYEVIFEDRRESNPCALCSRMRRGALNDLAIAQGCGLLALGHHYEDAVDTFFLNLFYGGRLGCFEPVTAMSRSGITQIRPLLYVHEDEILTLTKQLELPVVKSPCPMDKTSRREEVRELQRKLRETYPDLSGKIFGAMQRFPFPGWEPEPPRPRRSRTPREPDVE